MWADMELERLHNMHQDEWDEDDWMSWAYIKGVGAEEDWVNSQFDYDRCW